MGDQDSVERVIKIAWRTHQVAPPSLELSDASPVEPPSYTATIGRIRDVAARSPLSRLTESPIIRRRWRRSEEPPRPGTTAQAQPESVEFKGAMISGATITVHLQVASL